MTVQSLLRLYPRAWRARYETEMLALLEQTPPSAGLLVDLVAGAALEHVRAFRSSADRLPTSHGAEFLRGLLTTVVGGSGFLGGTWALARGLGASGVTLTPAFAGWSADLFGTSFPSAITLVMLRTSIPTVRVFLQRQSARLGGTDVSVDKASSWGLGRGEFWLWMSALVCCSVLIWMSTTPSFSQALFILLMLQSLVQTTKTAIRRAIRWQEAMARLSRERYEAEQLPYDAPRPAR